MKELSSYKRNIYNMYKQHNFPRRLPACLLRLLTVVAAFGSCLTAAAQTLEACQRAAEQNYPLIARYGLIESSTQTSVGKIQKGWFPQVTAYAQATLQNRVVEMPSASTTLMEQQGIAVDGLKKLQYKAGVDVTQAIYDGGRMREQKNVARSQGEVQQAQNEVNLYAVRQRVNELYFGLLLLKDQLQLNQDLQALYQSSEKKLSDMVKGGTAATADLDQVRAERLGAEQQEVELLSQQQTLGQMLALLMGQPLTTLTQPEQSAEQMKAELAKGIDTATRPELKLYEKQLALTNAQHKQLNANLRPTLSAFAQGYYGYPGYNQYDDIIRHKLSLNGLIGVKLQWNIGALYTRKQDLRQLELDRETAKNQLDVFLFNNRIEATQQRQEINKYDKLMQKDDEVIALRSNVRRATESQLAHGIIDVNDLVKAINNENAAKLQRSTHHVEQLKAVYDLKYTNNQ